MLDRIEGEQQVRRPPWAKWDYSLFSGGPGVLVRSKPYWWETPAGVACLMRPGDVEPIENLEIAGRRWIASRVAWKWKFTKRPLPATPEEVARVLGLTAPMSRDGEIAVAGLIREQGIGENEEMAPGFRGPDEWYA